MAEKTILSSADDDRTHDLQANQRDLIEQTTELKPLLPGQGPVPGLPELRPAVKPGSMGRLGHYDVLQVLGQGGFGIVLKAFDDKLQRLVAIKVLGPHLSGSDSARRRFVREARAGAAVSNDHVVAIYAVDEQPIPYMVMEYIAGQSLEQKLAQSGPLELVEVLRIGQQVADGLAAAHAVGLIHRDIKPGNILLEDQRAGGTRVKITDFGLAQAAGGAATQTDAIAGTPLYMAPEQAEDEPIDHRADLFSLGSVLYAMCTGQPAFSAPSSLAVLKRVCETEPRPIREINPAMPQWLCAAIARLQAKKPADRFGSAHEVADLFAHALAELQRHGGGSRLPDLVGKKPARSRRRWPAATVAGVLLLGGLVLGWRFLPGKNEQRSPEVSVVKESPPSDPFDAWVTKVARLPADAQVEEVRAKLQERNPGFDGMLTPKIEADVLTELAFSTDHVKDLTPLRALLGLQRLDCVGSSPGKGQLADLSQLACTDIKYLFCHNNQVADLAPVRALPLLIALHCGHGPVSDLAPLKGLRLRQLYVTQTSVADLAPLAGMPLEVLDCSLTRVSDLSPLKDSKLRWFKCISTQVSDLSPLKDKKLAILYCHNTKVVDLSPLLGMPLTDLWCDFKAERDAGILRGIPSLKRINNKPAEDFWKEVDGK